MTVAVSTDLGRVEELGVGLAAGTAAGMDVGTGSATDIRTDFGAAFERAGGSAALDQTLALPGNGTSEKLAIASVGSNARFAGSESIKANWQPMQRLWSGSAGSAGEPPEEVEGESDETKAGYETGGGLGGRSIGVALAFAGRAATQSTLAASWRNGIDGKCRPFIEEPGESEPAAAGDESVKRRGWFALAAFFDERAASAVESHFSNWLRASIASPHGQRMRMLL